MKSFRHAGLQRELTNTLRNKEKVLWLYEDARGSIWYKMLIVYGLVFSLIWCILIFGMMPTMTGNPVAVAFFFLFPAIGVFQAVFLGWAFMRRNKFAYVVTTQRIILMNSVGAGFIRSLGPDQLLSVSRSGTDQNGSISFSDGNSSWDWTGGLRTIFLPAKLSNIPNARHVEELIYEHLAGPEARRIKAMYPNRKPNHFHGY